MRDDENGLLPPRRAGDGWRLDDGVERATAIAEKADRTPPISRRMMRAIGAVRAIPGAPIDRRVSSAQRRHDGRIHR